MDEPPSRILMIQDRDESRPGALQATGMHAAITRSVQQALVRLESGSFDVVLLCLTDAAALECLRHLKSIRPTIPVIVLTEADDLEFAATALAAGAQDVLHAQVFSAPMMGRAIRHAAERQRVANRLLEREAHFRGMANAAPISIWMTDCGGRLMFCNQQWLELTGARPEDVTGESLLRFVHPDDRERVRGVFQQSIGTPVPFECEYRLLRRDGTYRRMLCRGVPQLDLAGNHAGYYGSCLDITGMRQADEHRARKLQVREELERSRLAMQAMEQAIGVVSHELRAPIAGVRLLTECMLESGPARDCRDTVERIHALSNGMIETVESLLDSIRANSSRAPWIWGEVDLNEICRTALDVVQPLMATTAVEIGWNVHPEARAMTGDGGAIRRLLVNLLTNAYKHTREGSIRVQVTSTADKDGEWRLIEVRDTGVGIPSHLLEQLGTPFARGSEAFAHSLGGGTGLGLAICRSIASVHGGRLAVRSRQFGSDRGTIITAQLRADLEGPRTGTSAAMELLAG